MKEWKTFVRNKIKAWKNINSDWLSNFNRTNLLVVSYSQLVDDLPGQLLRKLVTENFEVFFGKCQFLVLIMRNWNFILNDPNQYESSDYLSVSHKFPYNFKIRAEFKDLQILGRINATNKEFFEWLGENSHPDTSFTLDGRSVSIISNIKTWSIINQIRPTRAKLGIADTVMFTKKVATKTPLW